MSVYAGVSAVLPGLQAEAEALMVETVRIDRVTGTDVDDNANTIVTLLDPPVYVGPAKIQTFRPYEQERDASGSQAVLQRYEIHIPEVTRIAQLLGTLVSTWNGPVEVGDRVSVTSDAGARTFRVAGTNTKTFATSQKLMVDEVTGGLGS